MEQKNLYNFFYPPFKNYKILIKKLFIIFNNFFVIIYAKRPYRTIF